MSKLSLTFLVLSVALACTANERPRSQPDSASEFLPDAPEPHAVNLGADFSRESPYANVRDALHNRPPAIVKLLEGSRVKLRLISPVSSKSPNGSSFQARIDEPLVSNGRVLLPKGTLFEGHLESKRASRLMRPGSLYLAFDRLIFPNGDIQRANMHLVSTGSTAIKPDGEGMLHPKLSKKRLFLQVGGAALTAKLADDLAELAGGTAIGAGSARLIGAGAAATFFVFQKGREVKLRPGDTLEAEFDLQSQRIPIN